MFNRSPFNQTAFNRPTTTDVIMSVTFDGMGESVFQSNVEYLGIIAMDGNSEFLAIAITEKYFGLQFDGEGLLKASFLREIHSNVTMPGIAVISAKANYSHVDKLHFTGDFKPGDRIVMDSKNLTVTLNGVNALQYVEGDLVDLVLGQNLITYTDNESNRSVQLQITHRDKFV